MKWKVGRNPPGKTEKDREKAVSERGVEGEREGVDEGSL